MGHNANGHDNKKYEKCSIKYKDCECRLEYTSVRDDLIEYKCLRCNKNCQKKFDENLKKQFSNTYQFSIHDTNQFILLLRKIVYLYKYMDNCEKFNETSWPEKKDFYSHLNMEDITDSGYAHAKRDFEIKNLGEHHSLHV